MLILLPGQSQGNSFQTPTPPLSVADYFKDVGAALAKRGLVGRVGFEDGIVELCLPRFRFCSCLSLRDSLQEMGIAEAFDAEKADFSGMTSNAPA